MMLVCTGQDLPRQLHVDRLWRDLIGVIHTRKNSSRVIGDLTRLIEDNA